MESVQKVKVPIRIKPSTMCSSPSGLPSQCTLKAKTKRVVVLRWGSTGRKSPSFPMSTRPMLASFSLHASLKGMGRVKVSPKPSVQRPCVISPHYIKDFPNLSDSDSSKEKKARVVDGSVSYIHVEDGIESKYIGELKSGVPNGVGELKSSKYIYNGSWKNGKMHGRGTKQWVIGKSYSGFWENGLMSGYGQMRYEIDSGLDYYQGYWLNGEWHGWGTLVDCEGFKYVGPFERGLEVLSSNFLKSSSQGDLAIRTHFFRLLLSDRGESLRWCNRLPHKILCTLFEKLQYFLPKNLIEQTLSVQKFIDRCSSTGVASISLINLTRSKHCFLLGVEKNRLGEIDLILFDSDSSTYSYESGSTVDTAKTFTLRDPEALIKTIEDIDRCDTAEEISLYLEQGNMTQRVPELTLHQRRQKGLSCSLDCWLTVLRYYLDNKQWLELRLKLFDEAERFCLQMSQSKAFCPDMQAKYAVLSRVAQEKKQRREVKLARLAAAS
jgi:hypothetical protein